MASKLVMLRTGVIVACSAVQETSTSTGVIEGRFSTAVEIISSSHAINKKIMIKFD